MALVSGNRSAQDRLWWHQSSSGTLGSGLEDGAARGQRTHGRASQSGREDPQSRGWEEEGSRDGCDLATGSGGVVGAQRGSDEPDQMDVAFPDAAGQGTLWARTSYQEDGAGRRAAQARLFAQGEQENDGRHVSWRSRSAVWAYYGPVPAVRAEASACHLGGLQEERTPGHVQEPGTRMATQRARDAGERLRLPLVSQWQSHPVWDL